MLQKYIITFVSLWMHFMFCYQSFPEISIGLTDWLFLQGKIKKQFFVDLSEGCEIIPPNLAMNTEYFVSYTDLLYYSIEQKSWVVFGVALKSLTFV